MIPLRTIRPKAEPIKTTDGASAGGKIPLRANASQMRQARPIEIMAPNVVRIRWRLLVTSKFHATE